MRRAVILGVTLTAAVTLAGCGTFDRSEERIIADGTEAVTELGAPAGMSFPAPRPESCCYMDGSMTYWVTTSTTADTRPASREALAAWLQRIGFTPEDGSACAVSDVFGKELPSSLPAISVFNYQDTVETSARNSGRCEWSVSYDSDKSPVYQDTVSVSDLELLVKGSAGEVTVQVSRQGDQPDRVKLTLSSERQ